MKGTGGLAGAPRPRQASRSDHADPSPAESQRPQITFRTWAASLTPDDIGGAAVLFGLLFAALGFGGW